MSFTYNVHLDESSNSSLFASGTANSFICMDAEKKLHVLSSGPAFLHYISSDYGETWSSGTAAYTFKSGSSYVYQQLVPYGNYLLSVNWQPTNATNWLTNYLPIYSFYNGSSWTTPRMFGKGTWAGTYTFTSGQDPTGTGLTYWGNVYSIGSPKAVVTGNGIYCFYDYSQYGSANWCLYYSRYIPGSNIGVDDNWTEKTKIIDSSVWASYRYYNACSDYDGNVHLVYFDTSAKRMKHTYCVSGTDSWATPETVPLPTGGYLNTGSLYNIDLFVNQLSGELYLIHNCLGASGYHVFKWSPSTGFVIDGLKAPDPGYSGGITQNAQGDFLLVGLENPYGTHDWNYYVYKRTLADPNTWTKSVKIDSIDKYGTDAIGDSPHRQMRLLPQQSYPRLGQTPNTGICFIRPSIKEDMYATLRGLAYTSTEAYFPTPIRKSRFSAVFDTEDSMWGSCQKVAQVGRGSLVWKGSKLSIVYDAPSDPVQLFNVGNIVKDSFKETFLSAEDRAAEIEVDYIDADRGYERSKVSVINSSMNPSNKVSIQLIGINSEEQAWRAANYRLLCNQYLLRTVEFDVDIEALAATVGSVIRVQHDVPEWGEGGRCVSGSTLTSIKLDKAVSIDNLASTYELLIRYADDSIDTRTIVNPSATGDYSTVTVTTSCSQVPAEFDLWTFGVQNYSTKDFRITEISKNSDNSAHIVAVEYNELVYDCDTGFPTSAATYIPPVTTIALTNLTVTESAPINESGTYVRSLIVNFEISDQTNYDHSIVYYKKTEDVVWTEAGTTRGLTYTIYNVDPVANYVVKVVAVNRLGEQSPSDDVNFSPTATIVTTSGPTYSTSVSTGIGNVSGLELEGQGNDSVAKGCDFYFKWNALDVVEAAPAGDETNGAGSISVTSWLKDYEVIIQNLDGTVRRYDFTNDNEYVYTNEMNINDGDGIAATDIIFYVRATDINFRQSERYAGITVSSTGLSNYSEAAFLSGTSAPVGTVGDMGDMFIDTITRMLYKKTAVTTWTYVGTVGA